MNLNPEPSTNPVLPTNPGETRIKIQNPNGMVFEILENELPHYLPYGAVIVSKPIPFDEQGEGAPKEITSHYDGEAGHPTYHSVISEPVGKHAIKEQEAQKETEKEQEKAKEENKKNSK